MLEHQNECCLICNKNDEKALCVDHCHKTGKVRGLLCNKCNKALGLFNDNIELIKVAASYLERFKD